MNLTSIATTFSAQLPAWVLDELSEVPDCLPEVTERMTLVHRLAERNVQEGTGGPFAALVVDEAGRILSAGVNLVLASNLSSMHAEVVALSLAQARLGGWDLGDTSAAPVELMVNWRPCVMCYGAAMWSGIERLTIGGEGNEVEVLTGFDEGPMREDWKEQFHRRGIAVRTDVLRAEAVEVFRRYGMRDDVTVYNSRRGAASERV